MIAPLRPFAPILSFLCVLALGCSSSKTNSLGAAGAGTGGSATTGGSGGAAGDGSGATAGNATGGSSGGSSGGSAGAGGTTSSGAGSFFPDNSQTGSTNGTEPQLAVDASGRLHLLYSGISMNGEGVYPVRYGACTSDCGQPANWTFVTVADHGVFGGHARFAVDAAGRVRLNFVAETDLGVSSIVVSECDADCTLAESWQSGEIAPFTSGTYLMGDGANIGFGADGQVLLTFLAGTLNFAYGECSAACTTPGGWTFIELGANAIQPALVTTAAGQPRIAFKDRNSNVIGWTQCDADCTVLTNWSANLPLYLHASEHFAVALDAADRPRIVWNQGDTAIAGEEARDNKVFYGWCDAGCTADTSWQAFDVGLPANDGKQGLALAIDPDGLPAIAYDQNAPSALSLAVCSEGCNTANAVWGALTVETGDDVAIESPSPLPACNPTDTPSAYWYPGSNAALIVNVAQSALQLVNRTYTIESCGVDTREGVNLVRFTNIPL